MAEQFFHLNKRLRENRLKVIQEAQKTRLENELANIEDPSKYGDFDSVESLRKAVFDSYDKIAPVLNANFAMQNQRSKESSVLQGAQRIRGISSVTDAVNEKRDLYFDLMQDIVGAFSDKKQSAHEMMLKTIESNQGFSYAFNERAKTSSNFSAVQSSMEYLKNNIEGIIAFDLETFGGKNKHGKQTVDKITEFSFLTYDSINSNTASKQITGYVGITSREEEMKYRAMLDKFKSSPTSLTNIEEITLRSFAKLGSGGLTVVEDENVAGRFKVEKGIDEREIKLTAENIEAGIKEARRIGDKQSRSIVENGIMQWEKDLSDAILDIQKSNKSVLGHNIINADIPWLNQYLSGARKEVQDYILGQGGSLNLNIDRNRIADTLPLMQHAMSNEKFRKDYLDNHTRALLAQYGLSPNTLEALTLRGLTEEQLAERSGSHTSIYDAQQTFGILRKTVADKNIVDYALEAGSEVNKNNVFGQVKTDGSQLFYATRAFGGNQDGILGFKIDPFDGQYYTTDGYVVNPTELTDGMKPADKVKYNRGFNDYVTKKGMSYTVEGIVELEAIKKGGSAGYEHLGRYIEKMKEAHPALAVNDLVAVKMKTVSEYHGNKVLSGSAAQAPKNETESYIIAPKKEIQNFFNNNMVMYAEKNESGHFELKKGAQRLLGGHIVSEAENGLEISETKGSGNLIRDIIESGNRANVDDTAGRIIREMDFDKFRRFNELSKVIEEESANLKGGRKEAIEKALENGRKIAEKVAKNIPLTEAEQNAGVLYDILSYEDFEGNRALHPGRVNNAVAMIDYFRNMSPVIDGIMGEVNKRGKNDAEKSYLLRQAMDVAIHNIEQFNNRQADVKDVVLREVDKNYFEIPLLNSSERGTPLSRLAINNLNSDILRVNLNNGEGSLLNKIVDDKYVGNKTEQKKRLYMLIDAVHESNKHNNNLKGFSIRNNIFGDMDPREYLEKNQPYVIARDFIEQLKLMREHDPNIGYITPPRAQTITGTPDITKAINNGLDIKNVVGQSIDAIKNHKPGTIIDIRGISRNESELNKRATDIVTNILMDKFNKDEFKKLGYTDEQVNWLAKAREIRERDYTAMVKELLKGVSSTGMSLHFDRGTGLFAIQDGERMIDLSDVPRERIVDGVIYTQVGRNRIGVMTHLDIDAHAGTTQISPSQISLKSDIGVAMKEAFPLEAAVINQQKRGLSPINTIQSYISSIASHLREGSAVDRLDEQDSKSMFHLIEKQFVNNLAKMPGIDDVQFGLKGNEVALEEKKYFLEEIKKKGFEYDRMNDSMKGIYVKYRRDIMDHVFNQVGVGDEVKGIIDLLSNRAKAGLAADGTVKILGPQYEMELFNNPNRLFETSARYLGFREDEALRRLDELSTEENKLKDKVYLGANLRTSVGMSYSRRDVTGVDTIVHTEAVVKRAYVGAEDFKRRVYNAAVSSTATIDDKWASERLRESGNIYEGGAVASSRLGDVMFQTYDRQRVSFSRKLFDDLQFSVDQIEEMQKYSEVVPEIKIGPNGEVSFKYRKGKYYKQGETFLTEHAYGDSLNKIATKNDGVLRLGFFTKSFGVLANEDEVAKNVVAYARDRGLEVADENAFMKIAGEIYDTNFYIERVKEATYRKIHEDRSEKGMTAFTYTGLGDSVKEIDGKVAGDKRIIKALEGAGLESLKGQVLRKEFFDELKTGNIDGGIIAQMSSKELTSASFEEAVKQAGFKNVEEFGRAIDKERHYLSDFMSKQFDGALYISNTEDVKHKNVGRPISMMVNEMFATHLQNGMSEDEAAKAVQERLEGVFVGSGGRGLKIVGGRLATPQMDFLDDSKIHYNQLKEAYTEITGKDINAVFNKFMTDENGRAISGVGYSAISLADDHTSITGAIKLGLTKRDDAFQALQKGFKITDREYLHMQMARLHDDFIESSQSFLDDETFRNAYGFMVDFDETGKAVLKDEYRGKAFMDPFVEIIRRDQFAQNGDELLLERAEDGSYNVVQMQKGIKVGDEISYDTIHNIKPGERISPEVASTLNLSDEKVRYINTALGAAEASGGNVSVKSAELLYSTASNKLAIDYNLGNINESKLMENDDFKFKKFTLSEIDFTSGGDAQYFKDGVANSIYNQNTIIDLSEIDSKILAEAGVRGNQIAVGAIPFQSIGNNVMQQQVHKHLKDIQTSANYINGGFDDIMNPMEHDYERHRNIIKDRLMEINRLMSEYTSSKTGALKQVSEIRLENSAIGKAALMTLEDVPHNQLEVLKNVKFDGRSILEHHKSGVLLDFDIVSRDFVEKMGLFEDDYIKEVLGEGGTKAQMEEILRSGVQVMTHRNPTIYEGSIKPGIMILSDNTYGNEVISYSAGALTQKKDADGDQTKITLLQASDDQGNKIDSIRYQVLGDQADASTKQGFDMYKAYLYRNATELNPFFAEEVRDNMRITTELEKRAADSIVEARSVTSGIVRPEITHLPSEKLRQQYYDDFVRVEDRARQLYQSEHNTLKGFDDDYKTYMTRAVQDVDEDAFRYYGGRGAGFAVDYYLRDMSFIASQMSSNKQASAGEINLPLYKVRKMRQMVHDVPDLGVNQRQKARILEHMLEAAEEAFLSPKHSEATIINNSRVIEEFNSAFRQATGFVNRGEEKGIDALVDWFEKNLDGRYKAKKPLLDVGQSLDSLSLEDRRVYYRQGAEMIQDMFSQYKNIDRLNLYLSTLGQTKNGVREDLLQDALVYTGRKDTLMDTTMAALHNAHGNQIVKGVKLLNHEDLLSSSTGRAALNDWTPPTAGGLKETTVSVFESAKNAVVKSGLKGKDLAFGALGIAGATMMLGFVGGNPSQPSATTAAAGAEQESLYNVPIMTDNAVAMMQANPNQGYIININATSPQGQRQAEEAIRQAMVSGYNSTNVNVAMNINNSGGNITDSTIERIIEGMLG